MPMRPARICACGKRVAAGTRCACQVARERERPSARQRGYDTEYQHAAAEFLRTHRACACGRPATVVMHVISIAKRPDLRLDRTNWKPGCKSCNAKEAHRDKREQTGGDHRLSALGGGTVRGSSARKYRNSSIFVTDGDFDLEAGHGPRS